MINIKGLNVVFGSGAATNHAVQNVNIQVDKGQSYGLVGESGSGKSTIISTISGLVKPRSGTIEIAGEQLAKKRSRDFYRRVQLVFQDPYGSLHPRQTIDRILKEPLQIHGITDTNKRVETVLDEVSLASSFRFSFPHQLSGGQRQRVAIARALILRPEIILLDEPTSALDVSVQAEVLNLLQDVGEEYNLTYILVSHNLSVVAHMCEKVAVMEHGKLLEEVSRKDLQDGKLQTDYGKKLFTDSLGYQPDNRS